MANRPVLRVFERPWLVFAILLAAAMVVAPIFSMPGCAIVGLYPAYRGKVLEEGTNKPIEGAGVLAVYRMTTYTPPERNTRYVGYQAVLTDDTGRFKIPPKIVFSFFPFASFDPRVRISIYKRGYANFSGGFHVSRAKHGRSDPELQGDRLPPWKEVTFWFPKLESKAEIDEHDWAFSPLTIDVLHEKGFPPPGTKKIQFLPPMY